MATQSNVNYVLVTIWQYTDDGETRQIKHAWGCETRQEAMRLKRTFERQSREEHEPGEGILHCMVLKVLDGSV